MKIEENPYGLDKSIPVNSKRSSPVHSQVDLKGHRSMSQLMNTNIELSTQEVKNQQNKLYKKIIAKNRFMSDARNCITSCGEYRQPVVAAN